MTELLVSIVMGSDSDLDIMREAAKGVWRSLASPMRSM